MTINHVFKDPGSAITHLIGFTMALFSGIPLLVKSILLGSVLAVSGFSIYLTSMLALYAASTTYHTLNISERVNRALKKIDHMMIFVFIAGTYTPICLIALKGVIGYTLLGIVWAIAVIGMIFKFFWVTCPKWLSSVLYIAMGWVVIFAFSPLYHALPHGGFAWLLIGGILYTVGGIIYALKLPLFNLKYPNFGSHEVFHLFVMAGSVCHFVVMYVYLLQLVRL